MRRRDFLIWTSGVVMGGMGTCFAMKQFEKPMKPCKIAGTPLDELHTYLCAFHVEKNNRKNQVEAHHYCMPLRDGVFQCVVMSDNKPKAKILGVEYIVTDEIFATLCEEEKQYWHPHDYEVTSALLVAPGMSTLEEMDFMKTVKTTWGKTWHTWADPKADLPLGKPILMDSFRKDGEIDPKLIADRDTKLKIDTNHIKDLRDEFFHGKLKKKN